MQELHNLDLLYSLLSESEWIWSRISWGIWAFQSGQKLFWAVQLIIQALWNIWFRFHESLVIFCSSSRSPRHIDQFSPSLNFNPVIFSISSWFIKLLISTLVCCLSWFRALSFLYKYQKAPHIRSVAMKSKAQTALNIIPSIMR